MSGPTQSGKARVVVAVSGSGRTLENFFKDSQRDHSYQVVGVIASSATCRGHQLGIDAGVPTFCGNFSLKELTETSKKLETWLSEQAPDWILLAGFLKPFPNYKRFENKVLNIHPALLPKFGGKGMYGHFVHDAVVKAKETQSGASVHLVTEHYDEGKVLAQAIVPVLSGDDADSLAKRVFDAETKLYPAVLRDLISGKLSLDSKQVRIYA